DHPGPLQEVQFLLVEPEVHDRLDQPTGATDHPIPAALRQPPGEDLEHAASLGGAVPQRRGEHGQLVVVGVQRRTGPHSIHPIAGTRARRAGTDTARDLVRLISMTGTQVAPGRSTDVKETADPDRPWITVVHNDPINLMSYVTWVFQ